MCDKSYWRARVGQTLQPLGALGVVQRAGCDGEFDRSRRYGAEPAARAEAGQDLHGNVGLCRSEGTADLPHGGEGHSGAADSQLRGIHGRGVAREQGDGGENRGGGFGQNGATLHCLRYGLIAGHGVNVPHALCSQGGPRHGCSQFLNSA